MASAVALLDLQTGNVLVAITLLALPIAAIAFARSGPLWQSLGKGRFAIEQELPPPRHPASPEPPVDRGLQATEARQMLQAKAFRQERRGEEPLDVEAEVARLLDSPDATPPAIDDLREEVRQLVITRNERRMRAGKEPRSTWRRRPSGRSRICRIGVGMAANPDNLYEVEELLNQPGTYFNPQTEVLVVVDDSTSLDQEVFNMEDYEGADWVRISDDVPVDEDRRDEALERFQTHYHPGSGGSVSETALEQGDEELDEDEDGQEPGRED
jgi:hypothetical protein